MINLLTTFALIGSVTGQPVPFSFSASKRDHASVLLQADVETSRAAIEHFFGRPFVDPVKVTIAAGRKEFDAAIPVNWGVTPSQCWMVGAGIYDRLIVLSPNAWAKDACDHKAGDIAEAGTIVRHELTHVIHGQYNPTHDFTGMDDEAWFIEGLATYVSGQLDGDRLARAQAMLEAGQGPKSLADAWSGKEKYGLSGSMAAYIDDKYGREMLINLLDKTSNALILRQLGATEVSFLAGWSTWLKKQKPHSQV